MTALPVSLDSLLATREEGISLMVAEMPEDHRRFLVAFKKGEPEWEQLGLLNFARFPAVKFRQRKLSEVSVEVRELKIQTLARVLFPAQT